MDERRVRPVLQQSAHEIRQQLAMRTDRCVDARDERRELPVQRLAHAVQALELALGFAAREQRTDEGDRMRVVGGELREHDVGGGREPARAREPGDVRRPFARVDGKVFEAPLLRALDLAVPVRALDEPDRHASIRDASSWRRDRRSRPAPASDRPAPRGRSPRSRATHRSSSTAWTSSTVSDSRSLSSASTVSGTPAARAASTSSSRRGVSSRSTRSRWATSNRGCSADSFTEMPERSRTRVAPVDASAARCTACA